MKKTIGLLFALMAIASTALADTDTCKIFLWDNDAGETSQKSPAAVMDDSYNSRYVWADSRDGNLNIYGRIWQRKIEPATGSFLVNRVRVDDHIQDQPDVAGTEGDFFFVVWQDSLMKTGELWQPYVRKLDKMGEPMTDEVRVTEKPVGNAKYPKIAVNKRTQDFVVVWQDDRDGSWDVWGRLFDYNCEPRSPDIKLNDDGLKVPHVLPAVSFTEAGIAVVWQDNRDGSSKSDIYYRYFKPDLSPVTGGKAVNSDVERFHVTPSVAASDTGYFTVVWLSFQNHLAGDVYAQRYYPDGTANQTNIKVNLSTAPVACRIPTVTMGIDNVSFWTSWADSAVSTDKYQIRARYYDRYGRFNTTVKVINQNPANGQRAPDVCRFGSWFSVAWLDSSRANGRGDIFGQYYILNQDKDDTLDAVGENYSLTADKAAGREIWYHPKKDYDNPATSGWNEDPIAEPESLYIPLDSAHVLALKERNIPNQLFVQITNTNVLEYMWRDKQGKLNSSAEYDLCLLDLGYAEDGSSAGTIEDEQIDTLITFANTADKCLLVAGNDFGEMYHADSLFDLFGSKYVGPGNPTETGNIQKINGIAGTFTEGMYFNYPYQQAPDNSVDIIEPYAPGSQLLMQSDGSKLTWGRATSYSDYYKGAKASNHRNVYLTFSIGSLTNGEFPSTASELTRRILAYQGFNVEPEPIVDLVDSVYTGSVEGSVELSWTAVSDDDAAEKASKYWLKYTKYNSAVSDLGKMSAEEDFIDTGMTYYQAWVPANADVLEKKTVYGFAPGDTLIFALKAGDESSPVRWGTLGNEPRIIATGDTVTPHTLRLGYTYGCVNDFTKSERIGIRLSDTLFTTWDASNLYLGYGRCDWRTAGDLFIYFDTRTGGADSTCAYNAGDSCSGFDPAFRPDFCLIIENGTTAVLKKATGSKTWVDSIAAYSTAYLSLDSINKYNYLEVQVPFTYLKYTVGNVFKYLVVCNNETSEHSWNAFPTTNNIGKDAKAPVAKYPYFYQINSLASGMSPRNGALPLAVELSGFACQSGTEGITLTWQTSSENGNYAWLIERSTSPEDGFQNVTTIKAEAGAPAGSKYSYTDTGVMPNTVYYYLLGDQDLSGQVIWHGPVMAVSGGLDRVCDKLQLMPCRPNPAPGRTSISYVLPNSGNVSLNIYDICGRKTRTLENETKNAGAYSVSWNGDDDQGRVLPAGVYFYQLNFDGTSLTQRMVLLR